MGKSTTLVDGWTHYPVVGQGGRHQGRVDGVYVVVQIPKEMSQGESVWRVVYSGRGVETVLASWIEIDTIRVIHSRRSVLWIHGEGSVANRRKR